MEFHSKTIIPFIGLFISVAAWFLWNLALSGLYTRQVGIYTVRDGFIHNFGHRLSWWSTTLIALVALIVMELVVQSVRRVYWPTDQDLMQRIEKDPDSKRILRDCAMIGVDGGEVGTAEYTEMLGADLERGRGGLQTPQQHSRGNSRSRSPGIPKMSYSDQQQIRRSMGVIHDGHRSPDCPPLAEERENPFEAIKMRTEPPGIAK